MGEQADNPPGTLGQKHKGDVQLEDVNTHKLLKVTRFVRNGLEWTAFDLAVLHKSSHYFNIGALL